MTSTAERSVAEAGTPGISEMLVPPTFPSLEEERTWRKQRLAGAFRLFGQFGFDEGVAGHITARDPELTDHFWVNPLVVPFSLMRVSDLHLVDSTGRVVEGKRPINPAAFAIHSAIHEARPEVISAAHAHAVHGKAWSTLGRLLDPLTQDACYLYGAQALYERYEGLVFDPEEGRRIAAALGATNRAVILANHGFVTVGRSVDEAAWFFITAERSAHVQLLAEAAGDPKLIGHDVAAGLSAQDLGFINFQPYWHRIVAEQPDLLK